MQKLTSDNMYYVNLEGKNMDLAAYLGCSNEEKRLVWARLLSNVKPGKPLTMKQILNKHFTKNGKLK